MSYEGQKVVIFPLRKLEKMPSLSKQFLRHRNEVKNKGSAWKPYIQDLVDSFDIWTNMANIVLMKKLNFLTEIHLNVSKNSRLSHKFVAATKKNFPQGNFFQFLAQWKVKKMPSSSKQFLRHHTEGKKSKNTGFAWKLYIRGFDDSYDTWTNIANIVSMKKLNN